MKNLKSKTNKMAVRRSERIRDQKRQSAQNSKSSTKWKEAPVQMKITGLNADCLGHIFKHLRFKDLLNVADSRKSLRQGVQQAFTSKYKKRLEIPIVPPRPRMQLASSWSRPSITIESERYTIKNFGTGLKFLRCFGEITSYLKITHINLQRDRRLELDRYLNDYCTETLNELCFPKAQKDALIGLKQPFESVVKLCVGGELGKNLSDFERWFQSLQHLELHNIHTLVNKKCIEVHLPHLKHLKIDDSHSVFQSKNVANCFRLNPQLKTLRVANRNIPSVLKHASELLHLEELRIQSYGDNSIDMREVVNFQNVKKFELIYFGSLPLSKLQMSFDQLEEFSIQAESLPPIEVVKLFIIKHPSVLKMVIKLNNRTHITEVLKKELMKTWCFGDEWRSSYKVEDFYHYVMEFERNN